MFTGGVGLDRAYVVEIRLACVHLCVRVRACKCLLAHGGKVGMFHMLSCGFLFPYIKAFGPCGLFAGHVLPAACGREIGRVGSSPAMGRYKQMR